MNTPAVRIRVRYDLGRISPNKRLNPHERRRREQCAAKAAVLGWHAAGSPVYDEPVTVAIHVVRGRRMDDDNVIAAVKRVRDSIFCRRLTGYGVTEDDSSQYVRQGPVTFDTGAQHKDQEYFEFVITPVSG